ncbi:hypothetical protein LXA43DRAFT_1105200 [Ganoderma leucocontextum]|nr:hypothetical protein LXA43DRAFT_1105200 [Ganoderma leucocontextum]
MALVLPDSHDICLCPLHTPIFEHFEVRWFTHDYETEIPTRRRVCCRRPEAEPTINSVRAPRVLQPFIFELIGQIMEHDCHLTADGYGNRTESPITSCWIEPPADCVSRREWAQSARSIHHVLNSIRDPWTADVLVGEGNPIRIQLFYEPPEGRSLQDSLPVYDRDGRRHVPTSLLEVPFGRTMRCLFTIHYSRNLTISDGPRMVYAEIYAFKALE